MTAEEKIALAKIGEGFKALKITVDRHVDEGDRHLMDIKTEMKQNSKDIREMREGLAEVQGARAALKFMFRGLIAIAAVVASWIGLDIWSAK